MFVETPRIRNSASARRARSTAFSWVRPRQVSLASIESKCGLISAPVYVVPPSSRMPGAAGGAVRRDAPGVRPEVVGRVLGGDPALQRRAAQHDRVLAQAEVLERLARGDPHLRLHEVDVGDLLGHGVLDLDARVHLDEDVVAVRVDEELHGAGVLVADVPGELHRVRADALAEVGVEVRRGRDLDDLLVAPLDRAVALEEVDHVAVRRRRGSAPRCAAGRRPPARRTPSGRRTRLRPRACRPRPPRAGPSGRPRAACRDRRRRRRP